MSSHGLFWNRENKDLFWRKHIPLLATVTESIPRTLEGFMNMGALIPMEGRAYVFPEKKLPQELPTKNMMI